MADQVHTRVVHDASSAISEAVRCLTVKQPHRRLLSLTKPMPHLVYLSHFFNYWVMAIIN